MEADERLLEPGWGGLISLNEALFIQAQLRANPTLRRIWRIRGKSCPLAKIAERAFPENSARARRHILNEQAKAARHKKAAAAENIKKLGSDRKGTSIDDTKVSAGQLVLL